MELGRRRDLGDVADLRMTLAEAKQLLVRLQQAILTAQAQDHAVRRPDCLSCGDRCHVKCTVHRHRFNRPCRLWI